MKTFYLGCKIDTNIPIKELFFAIKIFDPNSKKYILDMKPKSLVSKDAYEVFNSRVDISIERARQYQVFIYLYRSWCNSEPKELLHRNIGSLATFDKPNNFKKLSPLNAKQSQADNCEFPPNQPPSTIQLKIPRRNIFVTPEYPSETPNDPFRKSVIEQELTDRIQGKTFPSQKQTSLCGPAAYFYCLLKERSDLYIQAVKELWEEGQTKIGKLEIKAGEAAKPINFFETNGTPRISGIDWITMGSLRDSKNVKWWDYNDPTQEAAAITAPFSLHDWLEQSGAKNIQNLTTLTSSNLKDLLLINEYAKKGYRVVQLMSSPNIFRGKTTPNFKAHWIVWESPLYHATNKQPIHSQSKLTDIIDLNLFTWGQVKNLKSFNNYTTNISLQKFLNASFGAIIFKEIN